MNHYTVRLAIKGYDPGTPDVATTRTGIFAINETDAINQAVTAAEEETGWEGWEVDGPVEVEST